MPDKATGPMPPEEFKALASAPYGEAVKALRKYDPMFGRAPGEKFTWKARLSTDARMTTRVSVEAASEEDAVKLIDAMDGSQFDWEFADQGDDFDIDEIKPA